MLRSTRNVAPLLSPVSLSSPHPVSDSDAPAPAVATTSGRAAAASTPTMRPLVRRSVAACDDQPLLKEVGLRVLRTLVKHVRPTLKPVQRVAALLSQVSSSGATLFPDWSPPAVGPSSAVALDLASCTASNRNTPVNHVPQQALKDGSEYWVSTAGVDTSFWTAAVAGDVAPLQAITIEGAASQFADTVEVLVTTAPRPPPGEPDMVWTSLGCLPGSLLAQEFTIPVKLQAQRIKLVFRGHHKKNTNKVHTLKRVKLTRAKPSALHSKSSDVLASVERWLLTAASSSKDDTCREAAFGALMKLALATGAVTAVMRVVQVALAAGDSPLSKQFAAEGHAFLVSVRDQFFDVCKETGPEGGGTRVMTDVVFAQDRAFHSNGLEFQEGGKVVRCTGGNEYAALDVPFSHGKGAWEFKLEHDTPNGECSCFGLVTLPVTSTNYEHSSSMWMYRCYNGNLYAKGSNLHRPQSKVHPGDTVRFELDMDTGTCSISHNGGAPVQAFKDLTGLTVYPAIAFYSSNRSIRVLSVEVEGSAAVTSETRVARLSSTTDTATKTSLGVGSTLPGTAAPLLLGNDTVTDAIMFDVHSKATEPKEGINIVTIGAANLGVDTFRSRVGVVRKLGDDWVLDEPILFSLLADDVEVWSTAVSSFDVATDVDVHLLPGVSELVMKVACESQSVSAVLAVWDAPRLMNMPWWWEYKELEKANSPIVAAIKTPPTTFMDLGSRMLMQLQLYANEALRSMRNTAAPAAGDWAPPLERPFTLQVSPSTFEIVLDLLRTLTPRAAQGDGTALSVATSVLRILTANIRRLVVSGLSPRELGFAACEPLHGESGESKGTEGEAESKDADTGTLSQLQKLLEGLAGDPGCEVAGVDPTLSLEAGAVLDAGLPLFWRTVAQRQERVTKLLSPGGVMELHFTWPCNTGEDNEVDARFERAALLMHSLCRRKKLRAATAGHWSGSLHVVVEIPEGSVETVLREHLGSIMGLAGFDGWSFSEGCSAPDIQVRVERSATFDRTLRLKTEAGVGWVRLYPKAVASFDQVCESVDAYVAHHETAAAALQASIDELKAKAAAKKAAKEAAAAAPPA